MEPAGETLLLDGPLLAEGRREGSLGVGRDQSLVHVGEGLELFVGLVKARLGRGDRVGDGDDERSAPRRLLFDRFLPRGELLDLGLVGRRGLVFAPEIGEGRRERQELAQVLRVAAGARGLDSALRPAARLVDAASLPGGLRDEQAGRGRPRLLFLRLEDADRGLRFPQRRINAAGHPMALREKQPRFAFELRSSEFSASSR